jgi:hypothetical protein
MTKAHQACRSSFAIRILSAADLVVANLIGQAHSLRPAEIEPCVEHFGNAVA